MKTVKKYKSKSITISDLGADLCHFQEKNENHNENMEKN